METVRRHRRDTLETQVCLLNFVTRGGRDGSEVSEGQNDWRIENFLFEVISSDIAIGADSGNKGFLFLSLMKFDKVLGSLMFGQELKFEG
jgi:hypothetical protein